MTAPARPPAQMSLISPFAGLRPAPERAQDVIAPPYDVLDANEATRRSDGRPWSFLHISKAEIDLPAGTDPHSSAVYAKARSNFDEMRRQGVLRRDAQPCYYVYRLTMGNHAQIGLVAAASIPAYERHRIRRHEFTRPDKESDRAQQIDTLNAQTGPVLLTYRNSANVDALVASLAQASPDTDVTADDGVRHTLWVVREAATIEQFTRLFDAIDCLYIADGHHRTAAAARVAAARRAAGATDGGTHERFLAVIVPDNQVQILDYNRVVRDLNGLSVDAFLVQVGEAFDVTPESAPVKPSRTNEFGMYVAGGWYRLRIRGERVRSTNPVHRLDISLLQDLLLSPILGVGDPRQDSRIDFIGGIRGLAELQRRVDCGEMAVAFALFPTSLADLMTIADAGLMMPPKSTWFEPKLADGLVSYMLD